MAILNRLWQQLTQMNYVVVLSLSFIIICFGSVTIHLVEPDRFPTLFDGFWWTMTTLTTVGYGDYFPVSVPGRLLGVFLFIFGIGIIGVLIGKTVESVTIYQKLKREGKLMFRKKGHYVYIGWSKKTEQAMNEIFLHNPEAFIVLIEDMAHTPFEHEQVHFVQGDPSDEEVLMKANILEALRVAIFADSRIENPLLADGKTLLIASAVEALSAEHQKDIQTVVEVCVEKHISKFKHIRVDDFILSNDSVSLLMAKATLQPGTSNIFRQLMSKQFGNNIYTLSSNPNWLTYLEASQALLQKGAVLIAVNDDMDFKNATEKVLGPQDTLYFVCQETCYEELCFLYNK